MKVMTVFGTRPEAIKMAPIIKELERRKIEQVICVTAQHRQMLDQVINLFEIKPDYDLNIFKEGQTLTDITINALKGLEEVVKKELPDILLIQGDTTTVFAGALAAFYQKIKIGHVEAGLRSYNLYSPYPEEANRKLTGVLTNFHFAPTLSNRDNLLREGYDEKSIFITGNTVIDALKYTVKDDYKFKDEVLSQIDFENKKVILLTSHRRENIGEKMEHIFSGIKRAVEEVKDAIVVFPVHLNPRVREIANRVFKENEDIYLVEPLEYEPFTNLMARSFIVVTDSGGLQEEAPALGKPVLVIRDETERPEGISAGTAKLVGTEEENVYKNLKELLTDEKLYSKMARAVNPYGDGKASERIVDILLDKLSK
ncbi:UDP-N-acetylglucosamine 2-epimerase (non-hydrolyzing) [Soehngenia longivitae]|uniref:UDP-N-acetylglucosamine 2-epimerase (non-hydrolyzing) n=1 Tax=Soehngenia longivitae TaxID=2562294 RepID=A0A4Z0D9H2_9FIRM|nr:UDP-N-acetylglucosamine 2-epimerase (non-hydrolyzing) [Soehngenia longivitae]TFZ41503.1 UDP-N-acetylglucosamine 2-epimerase (non-hydrolyzing) [Soehngenia longivitae]